MSVETIIKKLAGGMLIKVRHYHTQKASINFKTGTQRFSRVDHYEFIQESEDGKQVRSAISKRVYSALLAFEIDPKFPC